MKIRQTVGYILTGVVMAPLLGYTIYLNYLAFVGGTAPIFGWEIKGSVGLGIVWIFFIDPIVMTVAYWIAMLVLIPLTLLFGLSQDEDR